jgi:hypothetical protein
LGSICHWGLAMNSGEGPSAPGPPKYRSGTRRNAFKPPSIVQRPGYLCILRRHFKKDWPRNSCKPGHPYWAGGPPRAGHSAGRSLTYDSILCLEFPNALKQSQEKLAFPREVSLFRRPPPDRRKNRAGRPGSESSGKRGGRRGARLEQFAYSSIRSIVTVRKTSRVVRSMMKRFRENSIFPT